MILALIFSIGISHAATQDDINTAKTFMNGLVEVSELSKSREGVVSNESQSKVKEVSAKVDFAALAKKALGKNWSGQPEIERKAFMQALQELLEVVVYPKAKKIAVSKDQITYEPVAGKAGHIKALAQIEREKKGERVTEKLETILIIDSKTKKINDAVIEGEMISANLKRQLDAALKKQTFKKIVEAMRKRVEDAKKNVSPPPA